MNEAEKLKEAIKRAQQKIAEEYNFAKDCCDYDIAQGLAMAQDLLSAEINEIERPEARDITECGTL